MRYGDGVVDVFLFSCMFNGFVFMGMGIVGFLVVIGVFNYWFIVGFIFNGLLLLFYG